MDEQATQALIQEFVDHLGIETESIEPSSIGAHQMYNIRTKDSKRLIGPHGEHLRSFNYLIRRFAERKFEDKDTRFLVDVNGYQLNKIQELEQKAKLLAERVRTFRSSAEMTPMTAYERMIIHSLFTDDPEITTESEGMGKTRHIILKYKGVAAE